MIMRDYKASAVAVEPTLAYKALDALVFFGVLIGIYAVGLLST